jgi:DNA-binding CsgD family transcriptional regulator
VELDSEPDYSALLQTGSKLSVMKVWNVNAIEEIFAAAAVDPSLWPKALQVISDQTQSRGAVFLPLIGDKIPTVPGSDSVARASEAYFRDGWYKRDVRYTPLEAALQGNVVDDLDFITYDQMKRHPYYQDFLAPAGLRWFAGVPMGAGDQIWCLSIQRGIDQEPFSPGEKQILLGLSRTLSATAVFAQSLGFAAAAAALEAFEISRTAAVLLNRNAEVVRTNPSADLLFDGDISIQQRRISVLDKAANDNLDRSLSQLLWRPSGASLMPPVALPRREKRPVLAYPLKLSRLSDNFFSECQAAVILVDTETRPRSPESALKRAFGLTSAEARLASHLVSGDTLEVLCERLAIAKETARNQLKSVFAKTRTSRQAELVLLMAGML